MCKMLYCLVEKRVECTGGKKGLSEERPAKGLASPREPECVCCRTLELVHARCGAEAIGSKSWLRHGLLLRCWLPLEPGGPVADEEELARLEVAAEHELRVLLDLPLLLDLKLFPRLRLLLLRQLLLHFLQQPLVLMPLGNPPGAPAAHQGASQGAHDTHMVLPIGSAAPQGPNSGRGSLVP